jgi:hypothetical protein
MTAKPAAITPIEDTATMRWLARTLEPVRDDVASVPTGEAIERIRARLFSEPVSIRVKRTRKLAA